MMIKTSARILQIMTESGTTKNDKYLQNRVKLMMDLIMDVAYRYGSITIDEKSRIHFVSDGGIWYLSQVDKSNSIIKISADSKQNINKVLLKIDQERVDRQFLAAARKKINHCIKNDLDRKIFLEKYVQKMPRQESLKKNKITHWQYYSCIQAATEAMIKAWHLRLFDSDGKNALLHEFSR